MNLQVGRLLGRRDGERNPRRELAILQQVVARKAENLRSSSRRLQQHLKLAYQPTILNPAANERPKSQRCIQGIAQLLHRNARRLQTERHCLLVERSTLQIAIGNRKPLG